MRCLGLSELSVKEQDLLGRLESEPELKTLFFRKVKGLKWFDALESAGYLNAGSIPKPFKSQQDEGFFVIPAWVAGEYLVKTAPELRERNDYIPRFLEMISGATAYAREKDFSNYRVWDQFARVVSQIPPRFISGKFVEDTVDYWFEDRFNKDWVLEQVAEKWLPSLLKEKTHHASCLALKLLGILYEIRTEKLDAGQDSVLFRVGNWEINRIARKIASASGRHLGARAASAFHSKLEEVLEAMGNDAWSGSWQPSMEEPEETYPFVPTNVLVKSYRECLDGWFERCPQEACGYVVDKMIENRLQTIQRLAIYFIAKRFSVCGEHTEKLIDKRFFSEDYLREFWSFINRNYPHFEQGHKDKVLEIIKNGKNLDPEGNFGEVPTAYRQAMWFSAVKDHGGKEARLYREAVALAGTEPNPSEFLSWGEVKVEWIGQEPEHPVDELRLLSPKDLAWRLGLGDIQPAGAIKPLIKAYPLRYYSALAEFKTLGFPCLRAIVRAYNELWEEKASLPWKDVWSCLIEFFSEIVRLPEPEKALFTVGKSDVLFTIGGFLESAAQSDDRSFYLAHQDGVKSLISYVLKNEKGGEFEKKQDKIFTAINTPRGAFIQALINLTLQSCRLSRRDGNDDHSEAWESYRHYYDAELEKADSGEFEFSVLVTVYLSNFLYMSSEWVLSNLDKIFDQANPMKWLCAMEGYYRVRIVYREVYRHLSEKGDLSKALDDENIPDQVKSRVVEHVALAYINDFDNLNDDGSMIKALVGGRRVCRELEILVHVVTNFQKTDGDKTRNKVYELWPLLADAADFSTAEGRALASSLCRWSAFVDYLDDERMELLLKIAPYADESYNTRDILESLARLSEKQPFKANEIWLKILEGSSPTYPEKPIRQILTSLIAEGDDGKRAAEKTVDRYIKRGVASVSKLWIEISNES